MLYASLALARLGAEATATAACAEADRGLLLPTLEETGVPVAWVPSRVTTSFSFHYEGDERVMAVDAVGDPWPAERAAAATRGASHVHVGALLRTDFEPAALEAMASSGARLLIDAQGLVRRAETGPLRKDGEIGSALRHVAILKLNEGEAAALAGGTDADSLRRLEVPEVILTLGSRGSLVVTADADEFVGATPVETADPTGAGDAFAAAYLWFRAEELQPKAAAAAASEFVTTLLAERA